MEKEFVPYEIALALKDLRFDEPCIATYNTDKKVSRNPSHNMEDLPIEGQPYYWQNSKIHISCVTAPLYQQAFRFFREKYGLRHSIFEIENKNKISGSIKGTYKNNFKHYSFIDFYDTDEEAELECLVKLIDIVKKQNIYIHITRP